MKRVLTAILITALMLCWPCASFAAEGSGAEASADQTDAQEDLAAALEELGYPEKNITITVPFGAGGNADIVARGVAEKAKEYLGVDAGVVNLTGNGGVVGLTEFIGYEPDGYNLISVSVGLFAVTPLTTEVTYSFDDVIPIIGNVGKTCPILCVSSDIGVESWEDFVDYAFDRQIMYACVGMGSEQHLAQAAVYAKAGLEASAVAYDTAAECAAAVLSGDCDIAWLMEPVARTYVESETMVPLCNLNSDVEITFESFGEVPSNESLGIDVEFSGFNFYAVPAGTPDAIVKYLQEKLTEIYQDEALVKLQADAGLTIDPMTSEQITERVNETITAGQEWFEYVS